MDGERLKETREFKMPKPHYQQNQVEIALAAAFEIDAQKMPAFRGRLRHLRKHGIPNLPTVGRGGVVQYRYNDVVELVVALELEAIGVPPAITLNFIANARSHLPVQMVLHTPSNGGDLWFVMAPDFVNGSWVKSVLCRQPDLNDTVQDFPKQSRRGAIANLSVRLIAAFHAIGKTEPAKRGR